MQCLSPASVIRVVAALSVAFSPQLHPQSPPPATPHREVADTYFGTVVVDPYRWMETPTPSNPEFRKFLEAQNEHARTVLDQIPGRATLAARIRVLDDTSVSVAALDVQAGRWFYLKTEPGVEHRKLYVRDGSTGKERLLIDPQSLPAPKGSHLAIDYLFPSPDGRLLAYGLSAAG